MDNISKWVFVMTAVWQAKLHKQRGCRAILGRKKTVYWRLITVQFSIPGQKSKGKTTGINTFGIGRGCLTSVHFVYQYFWSSGCKLCRSADLALKCIKTIKMRWMAACLLRGTFLPRGGRRRSSTCHVIYSSCHFSKATKFSFHLQK